MKNFYWTQSTEYYDNNYWTVTKIYAAMPDVAAKAIADKENWSGCHWDDPRLVFSEQLRGITCSGDAQQLIRILNAHYIDDAHWDLVRLLPVRDDTEEEN